MTNKKDNDKGNGNDKSNGNGKDNNNSNRNNNDSNKDKSNGWLGRVLLSHPCRGKTATWIGHPFVLGWEERTDYSDGLAGLVAAEVVASRFSAAAASISLLISAPRRSMRPVM
jgi:hypothetical protein